MSDRLDAATEQLEDIDLPLGETARSVNEIATVGDFGFYRVRGPFEYVKQGTVWAVVIPIDDLPASSPATLLDSEGLGAVAVADGEIVAGGIVEACVEVEEHDELHLVVDQYARGNSDANDTTPEENP